ncbi:carboxypeptidase-like regulatory domain-containing protein [Myxococcus xanthus]|uniref:carboxypeptidase-like regulatory domain-containing protein n=1 Tax=Myxococcus xanthus TaxID=34 RepID=UPI00112C0234|nr:carboxypeptidase-like regulatory domain-containing protein [Myxococcus xanthus]QDE96977.1 hypothetical protein BHS05_14585 [Myxococcus xanthus]
MKALPFGRHTLRVTAEGFEPVWKVVQVGAASAVPPQLSVKLRAGAAVSGTVVDARGAPVPRPRWMRGGLPDGGPAPAAGRGSGRP